MLFFVAPMEFFNNESCEDAALESKAPIVGIIWKL